MKAEFQKVESARREGRIVNCPKCPGKLESYKFMDFVLDRISESCEGIWLDKDQLKGIVRKAARGPLGGFLDRCFAKDETGKKARRRHPADNACIGEGTPYAAWVYRSMDSFLRKANEPRVFHREKNHLGASGSRASCKASVGGFQKLEADALAAGDRNLFQVSAI